MFQISSQGLRELDEDVSDFYRLSERYLDSAINLYGRQVYKKRLGELLREVDGVKPESEFDQLVLRNIQSNLTLHDLTMDYVTDPNFSMSVRDFFNTLAGEWSFEYLEERVRSAPWKERWQYSEKIQERDYSKVSPFIEEAQDSARR